MTTYSGTINLDVSGSDDAGDTFTATVPIGITLSSVTLSNGTLHGFESISGTIFATVNYVNGYTNSASDPFSYANLSFTSPLANFNVPLGPLGTQLGISLTELVSFNAARTGISLTASGPFDTTSNGYHLVGSANASGSLAAVTSVLTIAPASETKAIGDSGNTPFTFTVTRTGGTSGATSAAWSVSGSGAVPATPSDFVGDTFPSGTVSFATGQTIAQITVNVAGNPAAAPEEQFTVSLPPLPPGEVIIASPTSATGTIDHATLFSNNNDFVDFNNLSTLQVAAIASNANLYDTLGGNDTIDLPTIANAANLGNSGVAYQFDTPLVLGPGTDIVNGSDAPVDLMIGSGTDTLNYQNGNITAGFEGSAGTLVLIPAPGGATTALHATINDFAPGDTIDLAGTIANVATYDAKSQTLALYDASYGTGTAATLVATLAVSGSITDDTFALSDDHNGGTDITLGPPLPDPLTLAQISSATYGTATIVGDYTSVGPAGDPASGFFAEAFLDQDQIVIAFRGTELDNSYTLLKNMLADASFGTGDPTPQLRANVQAAANFLAHIRTTYPYANITLTGHSLGGAIAQLLGNASGYRTIAFNAPGAAALAPNLSNELAPATLAGDGLPAENTNYREQGDQFSLIGSPFASTFTLPRDTSPQWSTVLKDHDIATVTADLQAGSGIIPVAGIPDSKLSTFLSGAITVLATTFDIRFAASVDAAGFHLALDPPPASSFTFTEDPGSPQMQSLVLPILPGISAYALSLDIGGAFQPTQTATPGVTVSSKDSFSGFKFFAVNNAAQQIDVTDSMVLDVSFASSGAFGGDLIGTIACFAHGTRITTQRGEIPVEDLRPGDNVQTLTGNRAAPITWIGHRHVDCRKHPASLKVWPVRVGAGAFGDAAPHRDLWLSPDHAVFVNNAMIPIRCLINGTSIAQVPVDKVSYYHIELPQHDVLLANGLAVESYLDTGDRCNFANGGEPIALHPDFASRIWEAKGCAPLIVAGPELHAVRTWLNAESCAA